MQALLTVDQEVGGSSPPSCTRRINRLVMILGIRNPHWRAYGKRAVSRNQSIEPRRRLNWKAMRLETTVNALLS
jgi:hypothetical protein